VSALSLLGFVILARPSPSVLRAAVMGAVVLLAMLTGRRAAALPALATAVLLLVVVNPFLAREVGFALSVLATAALVTIAPGWTRRLERHLPRALAVGVAVPAAAQLACTPVLILAFGQLTPYSIPANVMAAPAVAPATVLGVVCAVLSTVVHPAGPPMAWLAAAPTAVIAAVASALARLPGAAARFPSGAAGVLVAVLLSAGVSAGFGRARLRAMLGAWPP
jgi:competence protein ComEC